ncbi:MAG TPA: EamA family transporter [Aggregatilineaceae bacterium]|nr:EamA family transporter [Aggregatilineaceae bacterium]
MDGLSGTNLAAMAFALMSAAAWGAGDFSGGLATRRANVFSVIVLMHAVGLLFLVGLAVLTNEPAPSTADLIWGFGGGLVGGIGLASLYEALAGGRMGITAPLIAIIATGFPVLASLVLEGLPQLTQMVGFGLALLSVWFIARADDSGGRLTGLRLILLAGLGLGGFAILIHQVSDDAVFWPLVAARIASTTLMFSLAYYGRRVWYPPPKLVPLVLLAGLLDVGGNVFFVLAVQAWRLDIAAVLSGLYPAITVLLAWVVLKEQISRAHAFGITAAILAIILIAL